MSTGGAAIFLLQDVRLPPAQWSVLDARVAYPDKLQPAQVPADRGLTRESIEIGRAGPGPRQARADAARALARAPDPDKP